MDDIARVTWTASDEKNGTRHPFHQLSEGGHGCIYAFLSIKAAYA
jgi:hypothetical protein